VSRKVWQPWSKPFCLKNRDGVATIELISDHVKEWLRLSGGWENQI
jgi:hypothetical protein